MNRYYVYYLIDPRNNHPFYVGKGADDRINAHEREARLPVSKQWNPQKCKIINEITSEGLSVVKTILHFNLSEHESYKLEQHYITTHGKIKDGGTLTNIVDGGAGGIRMGKNKPIDQYDLQGKFICTFESTKDAAFVLGIRPSQINGVLKKRAKQAGGFLWCYSGENIVEYRRFKQVQQITVNNELVKVWNSVDECCTALGLNPSAVRECISGKHKTSGGFMWKYV